MPKIKQYIQHKYVQNCQIVDKLTAELYFCVPPSFLGHTHCISISENSLVISASTQTWASKLRFYKPDILKRFKNHLGIKIKYVKIIISPVQNSPASRPNSQKTRHLSQNSAQQLKSLAQQVNHPDLQSSLRRLAERANPVKSKN